MVITTLHPVAAASGACGKGLAPPAAGQMDPAQAAQVPNAIRAKLKKEVFISCCSFSCQTVPAGTDSAQGYGLLKLHGGANDVKAYSARGHLRRSAPRGASLRYGVDSSEAPRG